MHFIDDHVFELLVIDGTEIRIGFVGLPGDSRSKHVLSTVIESIFDE
jgi:hypothetical protein